MSILHDPVVSKNYVISNKYIWGDNAELKTEKLGNRPWLT